MSVPKEIRFESLVRSNQNGHFLLDVLCQRFTYHTRQEWKEKIVQGDVLLNQETVDLDCYPPGETPRLRAGDSITYIVRNYQEPEVPTHFEVLYENECFLVVSKPADIPVHHTGRIFYNTFTSVLKRALDEKDLVPMHRLDRDTSGLLLYARNRDTAHRYQKNFQHILRRKIYLAAVWGMFPEQPLEIHLPLGEKLDSPIRLQMYHDPQGKPCHTTARRIDVIHTESQDISLVECELHTGRKHQIRAHLSLSGFPIVGDSIYSHQGHYYLKRLQTPLTQEDLQILGSPQHLLHAWKAEIQLPDWSAPRWFESRLWSETMDHWIRQSDSQKNLF